jgi:glycosyltransferase involved in cell wall biosynthesis
MKILHLTKHTIQYNGMVHALVDLSSAQSMQGHQVAVLRCQGDFDSILNSHGVKIYEFSPKGFPIQQFFYLINIWKAIRQFKPDIIHCHMIEPAIISWTLCKLFNIPMITCVQNSFSKHATWMSIGDLVITGSQAVAIDMRRRGIAPQKLRPILNGTIGTPRRSIENYSPRTIQSPAIISVCGMHRRKGIDILINAFSIVARACPDVHLHLVGEGPEEADFRDQAHKLGISNVHFHPPEPDPRAIIAGADVFVLASIADPAPLIISEAREVGIGIVATDVDGIPELLAFGEAGLLVPPKDVEYLAQVLTGLFSDPKSIAELKTRSQVNISELGLDRVAYQTIKVYEELLK